MAEASTFDLNNIFQIQVPVDGKMKYVERILNAKGEVLWQVHRCNVTYRDNIPVVVTYFQNAPGTVYSGVTASRMSRMYLHAYGDIQEDNDIVSGFSGDSYVRTPITVDWTNSNSFELVLKLKTGKNITSLQNLVSIAPAMYSTVGAYSDITAFNMDLEIVKGKLIWAQGNVKGKQQLEKETTYYVKLSKIGPALKIYLGDSSQNYKEDISLNYYYEQTATVNVTGSSTARLDAYLKQNYVVTSKKYTGNNTCQYEMSRSREYTGKYYLYFGADLSHNSAPRGIEPFYGTIDLSQSTLTYSDVKYQLDMNDDSYVTLIRDGDIKVSEDQVISGFTTLIHAHTAIVVNWTSTNSTTVVLSIQTGSNVSTRQELFGMESTDTYELEVLSNRLHWERADKYSSFYVQPNTRYIVEFVKNGTTCTTTCWLRNDNGSKGTCLGSFSAQTSMNCMNQHLFLGVDRQARVEPFYGKIYCKESYMVYNGKKYKFKI